MTENCFKIKSNDFGNQIPSFESWRLSEDFSSCPSLPSPERGLDDQRSLCRQADLRSWTIVLMLQQLHPPAQQPSVRCRSRAGCWRSRTHQSSGSPPAWTCRCHWAWKHLPSPIQPAAEPDAACPWSRRVSHAQTLVQLSWRSLHECPSKCSKSGWTHAWTGSRGQPRIWACWACLSNLSSRGERHLQLMTLIYALQALICLNVQKLELNWRWNAGRNFSARKGDWPTLWSFKNILRTQKLQIYSPTEVSRCDSLK